MAFEQASPLDSEGYAYYSVLPMSLRETFVTMPRNSLPVPRWMYTCQCHVDETHNKVYFLGGEYRSHWSEKISSFTIGAFWETCIYSLLGSRNVMCLLCGSRSLVRVVARVPSPRQHVHSRLNCTHQRLYWQNSERRDMLKGNSMYVYQLRESR